MLMMMMMIRKAQRSVFSFILSHYLFSLLFFSFLFFSFLFFSFFFFFLCVFCFLLLPLLIKFNRTGAIKESSYRFLLLFSPCYYFRFFSLLSTFLQNAQREIPSFPSISIGVCRDTEDCKKIPGDIYTYTRE